MEVNHEAMRRAGTPATVAYTENSAMEHDPSSAPQIMDSTSNPPMSFRSGAVPDQYESYPEVMPPQGPASSSVYTYSGQSPLQPQSYEGYQKESPHIAPQNQPLMQNIPGGQYSNGPMPVEAGKTYYQPTYGVSQHPPPTPYSNTNTLVPADGAVHHGKVGNTLPPPAAYSPPGEERKILGLKRKTFWIVLVIVIIVIIAAVGGAVGGILGSKKSNNKSNNNGSTSGASSGGNNNGTSSTGFTPFALTTGVRTLNLKYQQDSGSCNDPQHADGGGLVNCYATSQYTVRVDGSLTAGYTLSSVSVQGSAFSNIKGTPPTTDDPTKDGSAWLFEVTFTAGGTCGTDRITRYALGTKDYIYAVGEVFTLQESCVFTTGVTYAQGTSCTCVGISTTVS
ncbi:hypothetical protein TWF694_007062 [Orbilia ellipsospora]|uniref:Uncharacterized protein n=1 Tax=Orbilia ellipsospora TaxID=2528407 RepID=A0AAV9XQE7_9PEZI